MDEKEKETENESRKLGKGELAWYIIAGIFATAGLTFLVFGILGSHLPVKASENWVLISEAAWLTNWSKMGYRYWGLILIGVATLIACIALGVYAKVGDRDKERAIRRQQRLILEAEPEAQPESVEVKAEDKAPAPAEKPADPAAK